MRRISMHTGVLCIAVAGMASGCASHRRHTVLPEPRALGAEYRAAGQEAGEQPEATPDVPEAALERSRALALALLWNPELKAAAHAAHAAKDLARQAGRWSNPQIELEVEEYDRDGAGMDSAEAAVVLKQRFELGGKRRRRADVAEARGGLAGWDYESKRLEVHATTSQRFVAVSAAQRRLELAQSRVELADKTSRAVTERVGAGKEPPLQAGKAAAELELARLEHLAARNALEVSRRQLAAMWGFEQPRFKKTRGELGDIPDSVPALDDLRAGLGANPDLARWDVELQLRRAALSAAKAARAPDLNASVGYQHYEEDSTDALAFGVGFPLPLFDLNQGNIRAADHALAQARAQRQATETKLAAALAGAHATLASAHGRAQVLYRDVVPAMEKAFDAAHEGYRQGKFGFLDMLDAQRGLFEARGALVEAQLDYHIAVAEIQRLTGSGLETLVKRTETEETK